MRSQSSPTRISPRRLVPAVIAAVALTAAALSTAAPADAASNVLAPASLTTTAGTVGSGQSVAALAVRDQSGSQDTWTKYVEFGGKYAGYRTYTLPSSTDPADVTGIEVAANYRGPAQAEQGWTWSLYNWSTSSWTSVGTNASASSWGSWKLLEFASPASASSFVNASGSIRVRLAASNSSDAANLDFESVEVTSADGTTTPTTPAGVTLPPANGGFSYQLYGGFAPEANVSIVSRDRFDTPVGAGVYDICYVNVLQTQPDEEGQSSTNPPYGTTQWWILNHPDLLLKDASGNTIIDADWNEALFDVRTAAKRTQLLAIQSAWFAKCATDGFQAVEPDNLDAFLRSTGLITFAQTKEYMKLVVPSVHELGLAIAQKNTSETGNGYGGIGKDFVDTVSPAQGFDFAIAEECAVWEECDTYTSEYGDLVIEIEYIGEDNTPKAHAGTSLLQTPFEWICSTDGASRSIVLKDKNLVKPDDAAYYYEAC